MATGSAAGSAEEKPVALDVFLTLEELDKPKSTEKEDEKEDEKEKQLIEAAKAKRTKGEGQSQCDERGR